jgi:hypothetical protein
MQRCDFKEKDADDSIFEKQTQLVHLTGSNDVNNRLVAIVALAANA